MDVQASQKSVYYFLSTLTFLVILGIIMVYSSSYMYAKEAIGDSSHFFLRQFIYILIGTFIAFVSSHTKFTLWYRVAYFLNICVVIFLSMTLISSLGLQVKGSSRWIKLGFFFLQPGELAKFTVLFSAIRYFDCFNTLTAKQRMFQFAIVCAPLLPLILQPDFGTFVICSLVIVVSCFLSDFPKKIFYPSLILVAVGVVGILISAPYRMKRLLSFLDPWADPQNSGFQIIQSYLAFANGSLTGLGLGNSNEKLFYLPEAYNDFIFSVLGEELGFVGVIVVILLFVSLVYWGLKLAMMKENKLQMIFMSTIVLTIGFQAFLNMGVVLGLLPTKGLNLPFISYGGSSMVTNLWAIGIFFSANYFDEKIKKESQTIKSDFKKKAEFTQSRYRWTGINNE
ncbi:MAG: putative lipid II flippase FtsW [Bacteriovoracaceae bacterium]|nr:putative lipid II flippase FtsW [Bacteriovoracaceae bacterium]